MGQLDGKVTVVTGGTQGIGRGIATCFAKAGAKVVICSRSNKGVDETMHDIEAAGASAVYVQADVGIKEQAQNVVQTAIERFGRIDVLVNNAQGTTPWVPLEEKTDDNFTGTMHSGFYSTLWTMQTAFPHMKAQGGGRIINFGSRRGVFGAKLSADYNATKEAIRGLSRTAAREWGCYNILVNVVLPASESEGTKTYFAANPEIARKITSSIPLRRMGDPERDVGNLVLGLASDDACFITGESFFVDGGMHLKRPD
jgi:NAD(P)-dependent dehydrogenase (short-subunit alcohol dehydrogenase family)